MAKKRRRFGALEKVQIIREHLLEARPISEICQKYGIAPTQFYQWQKTFFENGAAAFEQKGDAKTYHFETKITSLEKKLAKKDEVIAEIMESHVQLKKSLGED